VAAPPLGLRPAKCHLSKAFEGLLQHFRYALVIIFCFSFGKKLKGFSFSIFGEIFFFSAVSNT